MKRTTLMLPGGLKAKASAEALRQGISLGRFIRQSIQTRLHLSAAGQTDPFFDNMAVFDGKVPPDISMNPGLNRRK